MPRRGSTSTVTAGGVSHGDLIVLVKASATLSLLSSEVEGEVGLVEEAQVVESAPD